MKTTALLTFCLVFLFSCKKESTGNPPVNNGPIGGTYSLSAVTDKYYDTIPGSNITTTNEFITTTTNLRGTVTISAASITSQGLMYDYTTTGFKKEVNNTTGATITTNYTPSSDSRGASNLTYTSNYTINTASGELTINDGQYLFDPAFILQPSNKRYKYTLNGTTLKITTEYYDAANRTRSISESTLTRQ